MAEAAVSLVFNAVVLVGLAQLAFPDNRAAAEPKAISVDLVPDSPKPAPAVGKSPSSQVAAAGISATKVESADSSGAARAEVAARPPPPSAAPRPEPQAEQERASARAPALPPAAPAIPSPSPATAAASPPPHVPPPIEGSASPAPRLVTAPDDPKAAATQSAANIAANAEPKPAQTATPATEHAPPPAPEPATTSNPAADSVPPPATTAETATPAAPTAEEQREAENTAKLAAALPYARDGVPDFTRAALSGSGDATARHYRAEVYGAFRKADNLVGAAKAQHLRGQTVVEFAIDDGGALTALRVAVSSGNAAVDETALAIIRRSAPFPPPPPGGQHVFSPAIRLGLDE